MTNYMTPEHNKHKTKPTSRWQRPPSIQRTAVHFYGPDPTILQFLPLIQLLTVT